MNIIFFILKLRHIDFKVWSESSGYKSDESFSSVLTLRATNAAILLFSAAVQSLLWLSQSHMITSL